ncbi:type I toxin-antitoxin system Fst family toxin [Vagococcus hydrophili]|uniref:Type I toxin-antitoxin system Fst family toxin n=1 Tax=Vagococcus hydrophili TaxID=2714947 RepID=A0A6G8AXS4_9ENTE|nr:type I toxin-antitoxin system Fst family toxin [Vagococcus hydrophili]QIL49755.1 type I toxin-antitoxin system Fst family toxin [Vagococcus hydrophili]
MYEYLICPLLVGLIVTLFDYWLNSLNKK